GGILIRQHMRPGVVDVEHQSLGETPRKPRLESIVVGYAIRSVAGDALEPIRTEGRIVRPQKVFRYLVEIRRERQVRLVAAHVTDVENHALGKLPLNGQVPGAEERGWRRVREEAH